MLFVLCVSFSSGKAGGGVLTFVLTLVLMFITTATITEQKPRSTLLQSWRKNRQASPLWEGAFEKTSRRDSDKFRFIFPQHFTQCGFREPPLGLLLDVIMLPKMLRLFLTDIIARRNRHEFEVRCL